MQTRPLIFDFQSVRDYLAAMLAWRRQNDARFSIRSETKKLYRLSPALVTQILRGHRKLLPERVEAFAHLLDLTPTEQTHLSLWARGTVEESKSDKTVATPKLPVSAQPKNHLLSNWLNVYLKDAARLRGFCAQPLAIFQLLGGIASTKQIERALNFLLKEGFLRRTLDGKLVENENLVVTTDEVPNKHIRAFHKKALQIAARGIDVYTVERREAFTSVLPLNEASFKELKKMIKEFEDKILEYTEKHPNETEGLYQVTFNLTPIGGRS